MDANVVIIDRAVAWIHNYAPWVFGWTGILVWCGLFILWAIMVGYSFKKGDL